ncbi:hypothetical protein ANN_11080 [Periplaneta americana]|uniref:Uncharacterized protein n=1 Tax=Periplaneta americana TaxID=6978 RepID=A0ABQ8T5A7_PERAM|nr:hypothetical protein ANN_11080 [Periplaneta americana]
MTALKPSACPLNVVQNQCGVCHGNSLSMVHTLLRFTLKKKPYHLEALHHLLDEDLTPMCGIYQRMRVHPTHYHTGGAPKHHYRSCCRHNTGNAPMSFAPLPTVWRCIAM